MRLSIAAALVALACASREIPAPAPLAQTAAPQARAAPETQPAPEARAAETRPAPEARPAPAAVRDSRCTTDADCTLTRVPPGGCCPSLCELRAVTVKQAAALDSAGAVCRCAEPQCAPERTQVVPFCQAGSCTGRRESMQ